MRCVVITMYLGREQQTREYDRVPRAGAERERRACGSYIVTMIAAILEEASALHEWASSNHPKRDEA